MRRNVLSFLFGFLLWMSAAGAQTIIGTLPFNLQNGTIADANQVMSDFNAIVASVNSNAANSGANSNITALLGLTTPLAYTSGGSSLYIGGTSSNVGNDYTVASPIPAGYTLTTGKIVSFIASAGNTGPTRLNVAGFGFLALNRQTPAGESAMVGGEITNGQVILAYYDGTDYECMNCTQTGVVPTGSVLDFTGVVVPGGWLLANGSAQSRTTFSNLFNAIAYTSVSATTTNGSTSVVVPNSALFQVGWAVGGNNVTCNSGITSIPDGTHIVINVAAGASGATTLTIGPYAQGDCSTTFNLPNFTGRIAAGVDGTTNITSTTCPNAGSLGSNCGLQTQTLTLAQLPTGIVSSNGSQSITVSTGGSNIPVVSNTVGNELFSGGGAGSIASPSSSGVNWTSINSLSGSNSISVTSSNTNGQAHPILPPVSLVYKIIKA